MKWFRWHRGSCENPKFALIATKASKPSMYGDDDELGSSRVRGSVSLTDVIAVWAVILEDAACKDHWGVLKRGADYIAIVLRWQPEEVQAIIDEMVSEGMLDAAEDGLKVVKWEERQYVSDSDPTSNERQKRYYNRHKRKPNALSSRPDTDTDTEKKEDYYFETGTIRLKKVDFEKWESSFKNLDLRAELIGVTKWAEQHGDKWFFPVSSYLAKRNREQKLKLEQVKAGKVAILTPSGNPWPEGII